MSFQSLHRMLPKLPIGVESTEFSPGMDQSELVEQLQALGREVARASGQFALEPPTKEDAVRVEEEIAPLSDDEALTA